MCLYFCWNLFVLVGCVLECVGDLQYLGFVEIVVDDLQVDWVLCVCVCVEVVWYVYVGQIGEVY